MFSNHSGITFEIINRRKFRKFTNILKSSNVLLSNQWVKEESTRESLKYSEMSENENTTFKNLPHAAKAVLRVKFIAASAYIQKENISNQYPNFLFFSALLKYN